MKKVWKCLCIMVVIILLAGCQNSATKAVTNYLDKYNDLDEAVLVDVDTIVDGENISDNNKELYTEIFKKQYTDLKYEVTNEEYDGDEAIITVKVTVYDLYKAQKKANEYLASNADEFNDENGNYSVSKFISYKLDEMKNTSERVSYTIDFYVVKTSNGWVVNSLSNSDLEKIHGIYNYES